VWSSSTTQDRPETLPTGPGDELAHLVDERDGRLDLAPDGRLDGAELGTDGEGDTILEQCFEWRWGFHRGGSDPRVTGAPPGP
jgi:hypothetical protein